MNIKIELDLTNFTNNMFFISKHLFKYGRYLSTSVNNVRNIYHSYISKTQAFNTINQDNFTIKFKKYNEQNYIVNRDDEIQT